ncbi:hypothetical protein ACQEU8_18955 [Streptomyces sp. CA-250714]|uniref:hypothetical protein n=1 Tax=Streptomyces sp. CA-250714 TaxID=3240060 RepID=UPI003D8A757D
MSEARAGRLDPVERPGGFVLDDQQWARLAEVGGNVAALHRQMTSDSALQHVPSLGTLQRTVRRDLREGRPLETAGSRGRVEPERYDRVRAELRLQRPGEGVPVVDAGPAQPAAAVPDENGGQPASRGGVRLFVPGARLVSTGAVAQVVEAVGRTAAARGIGCVFGEPGVGKTVAVHRPCICCPHGYRSGGRWSG